MRDPEQTKQRIITKALPIFNTKGYSATSLSDITGATGITKGAIYGNFKNKDEVALAAFELAVSTITSLLAERIKAATNAPDKLKAIVDYYEEYIQNSPIPGGCPVLNTSVEADDNHPELRMRVVRTIAYLRDSIKKILHRGVVEGQIKEDTDIDALSTFFFATIEGAIMVGRVEGDGRSYSFVKQVLYRMIDEMSC